MENLVLESTKATLYIAQFENEDNVLILGDSLGDALHSLKEKGYANRTDFVGLHTIRGPIITKQKFIDDAQWL